jgi:hypothetical protein
MSAARPSPLSIRLSREERICLEREAGGVPLGTFIKSKLFGETATQVRRHRPVGDQPTIALLLARLGASELAAHMRELADAARSGSLACDDEVAALLRTACADIESIRSMLVTALGLKVSRPTTAPTSPTPCQAFESVSGQGGVG